MSESTQLVLDLSEARLFFAVAEEASLNDPGLDALEAELADPATEKERAAALALTLGRAGRGSSVGALAQLAAKMPPFSPHARAVRLAMDLLPLYPSPRVERADAGYRHTDADGHVLYVEDRLAAHWHAQGRWGPPLRPDLSRAPLYAGPGVSEESLAEAALDGRIVVVTFRPHKDPEAPLRLTRAGFSRDPALASLVRWSSVRSLGLVEHRGKRRAAYETKGAPVVSLPDGPSLAVDSLLALMGRLLKQSRA